MCISYFVYIIIYDMCVYVWREGFPGGSVVNNPPDNAGDSGDAG